MRRDRQHTSTIHILDRYVRLSSLRSSVVLNLRSLRVTRTLCFVLDRAVVYLLSPFFSRRRCRSLFTSLRAHSPYSKICLPISRDRPFGATGCSRVPIVGAHNTTRATVDRAHLVSSNGGRTAVTRGNDAREKASTSYTQHTRARALASSSSTGTAVSSSCVFARVQDTNHRAQHPRSTMGDPRPTAPPPRRIAVRRRK